LRLAEYKAEEVSKEKYGGITMSKFTPRSLALCAMTAALYAALCLATAPLSYGPVQVRCAEALTLLPLFSPIFIWGVTLGCALSNLVGFITGANILGFADVLFGTAATLIAAICTYLLRRVRFGGVPLLSALPPVLFNAVIIGLELTVLETGGFRQQVFAMNAAYVGAGQAVACLVLGLAMVKVLERTGIAARYLTGETAKTFA